MTVTLAASCPIPDQGTSRGLRARSVMPAPPRLGDDDLAALTRFRRIRASLPGTSVHHSVTAGPAPALLAALVAAGASFDVVGRAEVAAVLRAGARPADLVYSPPAARRADLAFAARLGVGLFVAGSPHEIRAVAAAAPGSAVLCRVDASGETAAPGTWSGTGRRPERAPGLLRYAATLGLDPAGVSVHVGSPQPDPEAWDAPVAAAARVLEELGEAGTEPWLLDLGGGFPAHREGACLPLPSYGAAVERQLRRHFGDRRPHTLLAPDRRDVRDAVWGPCGYLTAIRA